MGKGRQNTVQIYDQNERFSTSFGRVLSKFNTGVCTWIIKEQNFFLLHFSGHCFLKAYDDLRASGTDLHESLGWRRVCANLDLVQFVESQLQVVWLHLCVTTVDAFQDGVVDEHVLILQCRSTRRWVALRKESLRRVFPGLYSSLFELPSPLSTPLYPFHLSLKHVAHRSPNVCPSWCDLRSPLSMVTDFAQHFPFTSILTASLQSSKLSETAIHVNFSGRDDTREIKDQSRKVTDTRAIGQVVFVWKQTIDGGLIGVG